MENRGKLTSHPRDRGLLAQYLTYLFLRRTESEQGANHQVYTHRRIASFNLSHPRLARFDFYGQFCLA